MLTPHRAIEVEKLQCFPRTQGYKSPAAQRRVNSWIRHSSEGSINRVAADLTDLEQCVAHLCDLRECYVHRKQRLSERELFELDAVISRWANLWKRLYGDVSDQTHIWRSPHFEKVIRRCIRKGHAAFVRLAEFALKGNGCDPNACHQELLLTQSLVGSISAYMPLYEAWCLLKNQCAPTDIYSDLARAIAMQPLACNVRVIEACYEPSGLLRGWLLLAVLRRCLSTSIDEPGAIRLAEEVIQRSSNRGHAWGSGWRDPKDSVLLLSTADGSIYFGVEGDLCVPRHGDNVLKWLLPWRAVYALLHSSGNKGQALPLLNAILNPKRVGYA